MGTAIVRGLTFIELLMAIAVIAVLASIAVPSFRSMILDSSMTAATNQFCTSLYLARNEAIARRSTLRLCKTEDTTAQPFPRCSSSNNGGPKGYEGGWIIYQDSPPFDYQPNSPTDIVQVSTLDAHSMLTIHGNSNIAEQIAFGPIGNTVGTPSGLGNGTLVLCDARGWSDNGHYARVIVLSRTGRIRTTSGDQSASSSC